jgi:antitoxin component of RelBE/YafQ-DinJ toxin-antitoxin module
VSVPATVYRVKILVGGVVIHTYYSMTDKELISVRLETDTKQRVEEYADEHGVSRSVAIRRLLDKGIDFEEAGLTVPDGGQLEETQSQVEEVSETLDSLSEQLNEIMLPLTAAILWIGLEITYGIPGGPIGTAVTGIPLILWLVYPQLRGWYE